MLEIMSMRRPQMVPDSLGVEMVASWGTKRIAPYVIQMQQGNNKNIFLCYGSLLYCAMNKWQYGSFFYC
jgi:hypothetical protein